MKQEYRYDVVVIGTGTAGQTAAGKLKSAGKRVAIIDNQPFGGVCALRGCQPKKYFVVNTHLAGETQDLLGSGFSQRAVTDWKQLQEFKRGFTDPIPEGTEKSLAKRGIDSFKGTASIAGNRKVFIQESETTLVCDHIIIATGSRPRELPVPGAEHAITSTQFLDLEELPDSMICIGGGYISLEFAFIAGLSGCNVEILQKGERILPQFPQTLVDSVLSVSQQHHVTTRTGVNVTGISKKGDSYIVHTAEQGDKEAALVLSAIGRLPNTETLNLDAVGIAYSSKGITVNEYMESSTEGVYAIGDCAATAMLSPVADMEAGVAVDHILNPKSTTKPVKPVPSVVFSYPPMASIGISAQEADKRNLDVDVHSGQAEKWATYRRINAHTAFYEIVIDKQTDLILGAHVAGAQAGEMINLYALAMAHGITASELKSYPWAYPTYTSDVKYTL